MTHIPEISLRRRKIGEFFGWAGTATGTFLMIPQVVKAWQTHLMHDVSTSTIWLYLLNCIFWLGYGIAGRGKPVIFANGVGLLVGAIQCWLKFQYG
jgi:uncharacterized protein with PQ loop repeat